MPARSDKEQEARDEVNKIINEVHFVGTFTVEFFIDKSNNLYVNEIAPRPHNSDIIQLKLVIIHNLIHIY